MRTAKVTLPAVTLAIGLAALPAAAGMTTRASVTTAGQQANGGSTSMTARAVSADGHCVAFHSAATNLVPGDTNGLTDIFVRNLASGTTVRASLSSAGLQSSSSSFNPSISNDGGVVAFESVAKNLVTGDANNVSDVFVRDLVGNTTERASVASDGTEGNGASTLAAISADGHCVAFRSSASNLVPGDSNGSPDIFVRDRTTGTVERVSIASDGSQGNAPATAPAISMDGRFVAFDSTASNLVPGDTNNAADVFVRDRATGVTERVSVASDGTQGSGSSTNASISADGRFVAFSSSAANLVADDTNFAADVFVHDRLSGLTVRGSVGPGGLEASGASFTPALSADGLVVAFQSSAANLVAADTNAVADVFVHEMVAGVTSRVSLGPGGVQANGVSSAPALSGDGKVAAFTSSANNLVPNDTNGAAEVFAFMPMCGDGVTDGDETCDDGNLASGDGCDSNCTPTSCGNEIVTTGEACDDGNLIDGDGCDTNCTATGCGNGIVTAGEACDDGNATDGDGCDANCSPTGCGNGIVTTGEACDDGNATDGDGCDTNCSPTGCGNGIVTTGEACDDANLVDGDGCDTNCTATGCENGIVTAGEACDDGNATDGDGCDTNCTVTACGNGVVTAGEECDDGNTADGDNCPADCSGQLCVGGVEMRQVSLVVDHVGPPQHNDELALRGVLPFEPGQPAGWSGATRGVQVLVEDLGSDSTLVDMTHWTSPVPPSGEAPICPARRDGWRSRCAGRVAVYRGWHGPDGPGRCGVGQQGRIAVRLVDRRARHGGIEVTVLVRGLPLTAPVGPVRATVVLGATAEAGRRGECGSVTLARCMRARGSAVVCE